MKRIVLMTLAVMLLAGSIFQCTPTQDEKDAAVANEQQKQYGIAQPVPTFDWSLERDLVIQLYRARNTEVATHSVWRSNYGMVEGDCQSIGFPIPYDTSLTNPLRMERHHSTGGFAAVAVEQAEPNGVFASKNSQATWVMCVIEEGGVSTTAPQYVESKVTVYPFPVTVDYATNRVTRLAGSTPSITISGRE